MSVMDHDIDEAEALSALLESDGWALFLKACEASHGDAACVAQLDAALKSVGRGESEAVQDTVQQIRARARAVQSMVAWPAQRVALLKQKREKPGMFHALRRA